MEGYAWWCPICWWDRWKAHRAALAAIRKAIAAEHDRVAEGIAWYRQNRVRVVRVDQGDYMHFEVQTKMGESHPWELNRTRYTRGVADDDANSIARHLYSLDQPKKVQVVG